MVIQRSNTTGSSASLKIKINYVNILYYISLFLVFNDVFLSSLSGKLVFRFSHSVNFIIYAVGTAIFCVVQMQKNKANFLQSATVFWGLFLFFIIIGAIKHPAFLAHDVKYMAMLITLVFASINTSWLRPFFNMLMIFGIVYIITTIWFSIDRTVYYNVFALKMYAEQDSYSFYNKGSMAGITNHYSANGIMLANVTAWIFVGLWKLNRTRKKRITRIVLIFAALIALILCGKRAHFLFIIVACLITFLVYNHHKRGSAFKVVLVAVLAIAAYYLLLNISPAFENLISRFSNMSEDTNIAIRLNMWKAAMIGFRQHPILGVGWYGSRTLTALVTGGRYWDVHNTYIQILSETGLVGAVFFAIFFVFSLACAIKLVVYCSRNDVDENVRQYALFSLTYQVFFLLYGMTGSDLQTPMTAGLYLVAVFISLYYMKAAKRRQL